MRRYGAFAVPYGGQERYEAEKEGGVETEEGDVPRVGFPTPGGKLRFFTPVLEEWGFGEKHNVPAYEHSPGPLGRARPREGRARAAAHLPPADPDPHALGERQVAPGDLAHQSPPGYTPSTWRA